MKKVILFLALGILAFSSELDILNENQQELKNAQKEGIEQNYKSLKYDWIAPIDLSANINRNKNFTTQDDSLTQGASVGFSQNIFESGGIFLSIEYAKDKLKSDIISWEKDLSETLQNVYETLLQIKKTKLQIEQNEYQLQNKKIELILKKIQYENGEKDIIELNNAIISKNASFQQNIALSNTLRNLEFELSKNTNLKYEEIDLKDFSNVKKDDYIQKNIDLLYEDSLVKLDQTLYKQEKTAYLPKLTFFGDASYSSSEDLDKDISNDSKNGSLGLRFSMPLYTVNKKSSLEYSRIGLIEKKLEFEQAKIDHKKAFDQTLVQIETYEKQNELIENDIELYDELISVNTLSNKAGMSSEYDLEILKNTQKINEFDLEINKINIQLEWAKLYFKIKREIK